jgi:hypothetical protein
VSISAREHQLANSSPRARSNIQHIPQGQKVSKRMPRSSWCVKHQAFNAHTYTHTWLSSLSVCICMCVVWVQIWNAWCSGSRASDHLSVPIMSNVIKLCGQCAAKTVPGTSPWISNKEPAAAEERQNETYASVYFTLRPASRRQKLVFAGKRSPLLCVCMIIITMRWRAGGRTGKRV